MALFIPTLEENQGTRNLPQQQRAYRLKIAPRLVAQRLQEKEASPLASLPPSCDRDTTYVDFASSDNGRVICATTEGSYILRNSFSASPKTRSQSQCEWDFVRCPIKYYGKRQIHPLVTQSGFLMGLGSGDYYQVGLDGRTTSINRLVRRPTRRYETVKPAAIASLKQQWNRTSRMSKLVEIYNWRQGAPLDVSDWDFFETGSSILAMQAGRDYIGFHDHRIDATKKQDKGQFQICIYRGNDAKKYESFDKCSFLSEYIVATSPHAPTEGPIRLWDLRNTRSSQGSLLSFPLNAASELETWPTSPKLRLISETSLPKEKAYTMSSFQRLGTSGALLASCHHSGDGFKKDVTSSTFLIDTVHQSVKCLPIHSKSHSVSSPCCLVPLASDEIHQSPSLLAYSTPSNTIELVDIHAAARGQERTFSPPKKRKTNSDPMFPIMGSIVGRISTESIHDEYGLRSQLSRLAWDKRGYRMLGLTDDFDVFEWKL